MIILIKMNCHTFINVLMGAERQSGLRKTGVFMSRKTFLVSHLFLVSITAGAADASLISAVNTDVRNGDNFVTIKAGTFQMGSPNTEYKRYSDEVLRDITISRDFEIQSTLVTQSQYFRLMGDNPSVFKRREHCKNQYVVVAGTALCPNNPVDSVSKDDAESFIEKLNSKDSKYFYRLPTEAEWEYSARAGSQTAYWFGNAAAKLGDYAWIAENSDNMTHAVHSKPANHWGIYDVHGNLAQWVSDYYCKYVTSVQKDPIGCRFRNDDDGNYRESVIRGGDWRTGSGGTETGRSANRGTLWPSIRDPQVGFRLVRTNWW
jgi:formylglycine-generating enzyme required for sulfatase activity